MISKQNIPLCERKMGPFLLKTYFDNYHLIGLEADLNINPLVTTIPGPLASDSIRCPSYYVPNPTI